MKYLSRTPSFFLFIALFLLRYQLMLDLDIGLFSAISFDVHIGWFYDLILVGIVLCLTRFLRNFVSLPPTLLWIALATGAWVSTLMNVLHFRFFQSRLEWWIVKMHWKDVSLIQDSAMSLAASPPILLSATAFFIAIIFAIIHRKNTASNYHKGFGTRTIRTVTSVLFLFLLLGAARFPLWADLGRNTILSDQVLKSWGEEAFGDSRVLDKAEAENLSDQELKYMTPPTRMLKQYRDIQDSDFSINSFSSLKSLVSSSSKDSVVDNASDPLYRPFEANPQKTLDLKKRLGFSADAPVNIVLLFVESMRIFELEHPQLGDQVYPELRKLIKKHGTLFTQAYSSSFTAGQTVRGQYSTLCSMLPNITGPAIYLAYSNLNVRCIQDVLAEAGYTTAWLHTMPKDFHNSDFFESLHGTQKFYDQAYFKSKGITQQVGKWGLADAPFLQESLKVLKHLGAEEKPFFANILTISSHHPFFVVPEGKLPEKLLEETKNFASYQGYLSRLKYVDQAVSAFLKQLFSSKLGDNTLVVMMGDHSIAQKPHFPLSVLQAKELGFRIPIALLSKNMAQPERINSPVHQVDVTPTLARIVGLSGQKVNWIGKGLFSEQGRPWVYQQSKQVSYRTKSQICHNMLEEAKVHCWKVGPEEDPLFSQSLEPVQENPKLHLFFQRVIQGNKLSIVLNRFIPLSKGK